MKEFLIISTDSDTVEYRVIKDGDKYTLYYSHTEHWTHKDMELMSATDDGNGIQWKFRLPKYVDYSTFEHVWILMGFIRKGLMNDKYIISEL